MEGDRNERKPSEWWPVFLNFRVAVVLICIVMAIFKGCVGHGRTD